MMKGLLFREFYLTRKTYLSFLGLFAGVSVLCVMVALSMICGNLQDIFTEYPEVVSNYFQMFAYVPLAMLLFAVQAAETSVYADYATGWMKYSYATPVPATKAVGVRYLAGFIIAVVSLALGVANAGLISLILQKSITVDILKNMLIIMLIAIGAILLNIPLALKYKTAQKVQNLEGSLFLIGYVAIAGFFFMKTAEMSEEMLEQYKTDMLAKAADIRDIILPFSPIVLLVLFAVSFTISIRLYQRREKVC